MCPECKAKAKKGEVMSMDLTRATPGPFTVGYDGPSRPIISGANHVMLSISKFDSKCGWGSYDEEDADCHRFAASYLLPELREALVAFLTNHAPECICAYHDLLTRLDAALEGQ